MRQISMFSAQNPAREAYSGQSGVKSAPSPKGVLLQDKFLATPMQLPAGAGG